MPVRSSRRKRKDGAPGMIATRVAEVKEGILQMESFMNEAAALASAEARRIDEIRGNLEAEVARREVEIKQREGLLGEKESALAELEGRLMAQIGDMEDRLAKKDELLESRAAELEESRSKTQDTRQAVLEAQLREELRRERLVVVELTRQAVLDAQLREEAETLSQKEAMLRELQESTAARIRDLEDQLGKKNELLERREAEVADLRSKLERLSVAPEGGVTLGEENVVVLEELEQGLSQESYPGAGVIGRSMRDVALKTGKIIKREAAPDPKKSRLGSLLAPVKKKA